MGATLNNTEDILLTIPKNEVGFLRSLAKKLDNKEAERE